MRFSAHNQFAIKFCLKDDQPDLNEHLIDGWQAAFLYVHFALIQNEPKDQETKEASARSLWFAASQLNTGVFCSKSQDDGSLEQPQIHPNTGPPFVSGLRTFSI